MLSESEIEAIAERVLSRMEGRQDLFDRNLRGLGLIDVDELYENGVRVASSSRFPVVTADIADEAITTDKLAALAVTAAKIALLTITGAQIADGTITGAKIATGASGVDTANIVDTAIIEAKLADLAVTLAKIQDGAVDLDTKVTEGTRKLVANMAGFLLRGIFKPDQLNGSPNAGEIDFDPIEAGEDYVTFLPDGSVVEVSNANRSLMSQAALDSYTGKVYIIFSKQLSNSERSLSAFQDSHILVVRFNNGTYQYDDNGAWQSFTPLSTDICIYEVDRSGGGWTGMPTRYVGMELLAYMETRERVAAAIDDLGKLLADTVGSIALQDNAVIARTIAAGAVFAQKLLIGNFFNVIPDPSFEHDTLSDHWSTSTSDGGTWSRVQSDTATPFHASWMARYDTTGQTGNAYMVTSPEGVQSNGPGPGYIECHEDDVFTVRFRVRMAAGGGNPSGAYVRAYLRYYDKDGTHISGNLSPFVQPVTGSWTLVEYLGAGAPAGAAYVNIGPHIRKTADSGPRYLFDAFEASRAVGGVYIENGAITTDKLFANAVTTAKLAAGAVTANKIAANTITAAQIATATITAAQIAAGTITATELAALSVGTDELIANSVTGEKISALTITAGLIQANAIETAKINGLAVTTAKIADDATSIPASAYTSGGVTLPAAGTETTCQSITFTSAGGPVLIIVNLQYIRGDADDAITFRVKRGSTTLASWLASASGSIFGTMAFVTEDTPGAGSVTYSVTGQEIGNSDGSAQQRAMYVLEVLK